MVLAAFLICFLGFGALSVAMPRHHRQVFGRAPRPRERAAYRLAGGALLALALAPCFVAWPGSTALVGWLGLLTVAAMSQVLALTYAPGALPVTAVVCAAGALAAAAFGL